MRKNGLENSEGEWVWEGQGCCLGPCVSQTEIWGWGGGGVGTGVAPEHQEEPMKAVQVEGGSGHVWPSVRTWTLADLCRWRAEVGEG